MRLDIAILEDNESDSKLLIKRLNEACGELGVAALADTFRTGEEFLAACGDKTYHIAFIDICLNGINGIETAKSVRRPCKLIFTTASAEHAVEAFGLNAAHYLVKPVTKETVIEALNRCIAVLTEKNTPILSIKSGKKIIRIPMGNIVYIEVMNKVCAVHTEKEIYETPVSLSSLCGQLDETVFMRAQQSFAVNMNFIESFYYDRVIMRGGLEIALSRNNRAEFKKQYQRFLFGQIRGEDI